MKFRMVIKLMLALGATCMAWAQPLPASLRVLKLASDFTVTTNELAEVVFESAPVKAPAGWDELVVSWNARTNVTLRVEAQAILTHRPTRWYPLGVWSATGERSSAKRIEDADGEVDTDTVRLTEAATAARVRVTAKGSRDSLKLVALAFSNGRTAVTNRSPERQAWGRSTAVPVRSQADFPEGVNQWCSPTCTSMLLEFWSRELGRPELNVTVPATAQAVFDPGWGGTGNWPFNTAFAGSFPGMSACVSRCNDLSDLERWVGAGLPAAASVSYALLKGADQSRKGDGHLVVVRGFTADGDVLINDPGVRHSRVQRTVARAHFERAWLHSRRTVYLVWPSERATPAGDCFP